MIVAELPAAFAMAVILDARFGDPPNAIHPVAWFGRIAEPTKALAGSLGSVPERVIGVLIAWLFPLAWTLGWLAVMRVVEPWSLVHFTLVTFLLKSSFSVRGLGDAAARMHKALDAGNLDVARSHLRSLCSRDARTLGVDDLVQGTVESVAENASDSAVAPFFFVACFGIEGALAYRVINTLDAMVGYRGRFEALGFGSARTDDVVNWIPARLTAGLLLIMGGVRGFDVLRGWAILRRDGPTTASPNAGRPMAAMAGLLGVRLRKAGAYSLGDSTRPIEIRDIDRAWSIARDTMRAAAILTFFVLCWTS